MSDPHPLIQDILEAHGAPEPETGARVWQSGEWTILYARDGSGAQTTLSLTRAEARSLSWKLRNSPRVAPVIPHWNGIGKYSPCISFDAGSLTINGGGFRETDGDGCFVFRDDELDFEQEDGPLYRWINVSNSDLLFLRDKLNELFPPASVDTDPKGGDGEAGSVRSIGSAVPKADAQNTPNALREVSRKVR